MLLLIFGGGLKPFVSNGTHDRTLLLVAASRSLTVTPINQTTKTN